MFDLIAFVSGLLGIAGIKLLINFAIWLQNKLEGE